MTRSRSLRTFIALGLCAALGCGGAPAPVPTPALEPLPSMLAYTAPGPEFVVVIQPRALLEFATAREVTNALFPPGWLDRFERRYSTRFETLSEFAYAAYPSGALMMLRGELDPDALVQVIGERMTGAEHGEAPARRSGYLGVSQHDVATLDRATVMVAREATEQARATMRLAQEVARPSRETSTQAPISVLIPHHLDLPLGVGPSMLFARQRAVAATLTPREQQVHCDVRFAGEFPDGAEENFASLFRELAASDLGAALGMDEAVSTLRVRGSTNRVQVEFSLSTEALTEGLRMLFVAEMPELLESQDQH